MVVTLAEFIGRLQTVRMINNVWYAVFDGLAVVFGFGFAVFLRFGHEGIPADYVAQFPFTAMALVLPYLCVNRLLGMYRRGWRYASVYDALALTQAVGLSTLVVLLVDLLPFSDRRLIPIGAVPVGGLLTLIVMGVGRFRYRLLKEIKGVFPSAIKERALIIGAGQAGQWVARQLLVSSGLGYKPVGYVDDDLQKQGQRIHGVPVLGTRLDIERLVSSQHVSVVILAIPSLKSEQRREILSLCQPTAARIKIMPGFPELLQDQSDGTPFRDARLEDLLGRPPVRFSQPDAYGDLLRSVLITGAAGSIGSELARQVAVLGTGDLVLLDENESALFDLAAEISEMPDASETAVHLVVGDVNRAQRVERIFEEYKPQVVFHAAAYKHVPLMEIQPEEAVLTNVGGTLNVAMAAERWGCARFVLISTDKAVLPTSVMGATKRVAERIIAAMARDSKTAFCSVRFGNVLGSRGSVVPTFDRQIRQGGPVTVTNMEMTRYFMTIPEASNLIVEVGAQAEPGRVYVLDMGKPVSIVDLAHKMIRLHGLRPGEDIQIQEIGLRPGEKLQETLIYPDETLLPTRHPRVWQTTADEPSADTTRQAVLALVEKLQALATHGKNEALVTMLFEAAQSPGFTPDSVQSTPALGDTRPEYAPSAPYSRVQAV